MPRRLAQQRMTLSYLEWPFHPHCALSLLSFLLQQLWFMFCCCCWCTVVVVVVVQ